MEGANASAEEADEGCDENSTSGIDIVLNHRLVETGFGDKKGFTDYLKTYMKKVLKHLEENQRTAEIEEFKANINKVMKALMGRFKDLQFFTGKQIKNLRFFNYVERLKCSQNAVKMQSKCSQNAAKMQPKCSQNAAKMQPKFGQNSVKIQSKALFCKLFASMQPKCSQNSAKIRSKFDQNSI